MPSRHRERRFVQWHGYIHADQLEELRQDAVDNDSNVAREVRAILDRHYRAQGRLRKQPRLEGKR